MHTLAGQAATRCPVANQNVDNFEPIPFHRYGQRSFILSYTNSIKEGHNTLNRILPLAVCSKFTFWVHKNSTKFARPEAAATNKGNLSI